MRETKGVAALLLPVMLLASSSCAETPDELAERRYREFWPDVEVIRKLCEAGGDIDALEKAMEGYEKKWARANSYSFVQFMATACNMIGNTEFTEAKRRDALAKRLALSAVRMEQYLPLTASQLGFQLHLLSAYLRFEWPQRRLEGTKTDALWVEAMFRARGENATLWLKTWRALEDALESVKSPSTRLEFEKARKLLKLKKEYSPRIIAHFVSLYGRPPFDNEEVQELTKKHLPESTVAMEIRNAVFQRRRAWRPYEEWLEAKGSAARARRRMIEGSRNSVPVLLEALRSDDGEARAFAVECLGEIGPDASKAVRAIVERMEDNSRSVCMAVPQALGRIGDDAVKPLREALGSGNPLKRWLAVESLGHIGPAAQDAVPLLRKALADDRRRTHRWSDGTAEFSIAESARKALQRISPGSRLDE